LVFTPLAWALSDIRKKANGRYAIGFPDIYNDSQQLSPGGSTHGRRSHDP
jgi:hypothetical protein